MARGRKSGKPFVMLVCGRDGRHFRGFITDQTYVGEILARLEGLRAGGEGGGTLRAGETSTMYLDPDSLFMVDSRGQTVASPTSAQS